MLDNMVRRKVCGWIRLAPTGPFLAPLDELVVDDLDLVRGEGLDGLAASGAAVRGESGGREGVLQE